MSRSLFAPIAIACTLFCAAQANAADTTVINGWANGYESVDIALTLPHVALVESTLAGGFSTSFNGSPSFTSYCINLYDAFDFGVPYTDYSLTDTNGHSFANASAASDIGKLFAEGNDILSSTAQAAMQIAIWEIAYETTGVYDLSAGTAAFTGGTAQTSGALSLATSWLNALATTTGGATLGVLESHSFQSQVSHQDLVFTTAVPEPTTYALMAAGLMCVGFVARRRSSKQA